MEHCETCREGSARVVAHVHVSPLEKALDEIKRRGLTGYSIQPGDSLVRRVADHHDGLPPKRSMVLHDLLRRDVGRKPAFVSAREALQILSRISSQQDTYNSHWAAPRRTPTPACDTTRLHALLGDIALTADAAAAADATIAVSDAHRQDRVKTLHASWASTHEFGHTPTGPSGPMAAKSGSGSPHDRSGASHGRVVSETRSLRLCQGHVTHPQVGDGRLHCSGGLSSQGALHTAPALSSGGSGTSGAQISRPMLDPAAWSPLAIRGTPLGHWDQSEQHRPIPAKAAVSTMRLDMLPTMPAEADAAPPAGRRKFPTALASPHLIGHWQRDVEAETAAFKLKRAATLEN